MAVTTRSPSSVFNAGAWTNPGNVYTSNNGYATLTASSNNVVNPMQVRGFDFSAVSSGDTLDSVQITIEHFESQATQLSVDVSLVDDTTVLGTASITPRTAEGVDTVTITGVTMTNLKSSTLGLRVEGMKTGGGGSRTFSIDHVQIVATHSAPPAAVNVAVGRFALASVTDPAVHTSHSVSVKARSTQGGGTLTYSLFQGTTEIAPFTATLTSTLTTFTGTLSEAQAGNISNYGTLEVRLSATKTPGPLTVEVSEVSFSLPLASGTQQGAATLSSSSTLASAALKTKLGAAALTASSTLVADGTVSAATTWADDFTTDPGTWAEASGWSPTAGVPTVANGLLTLTKTSGQYSTYAVQHSSSPTGAVDIIARVRGGVASSGHAQGAFVLLRAGTANSAGYYMARNGSSQIYRARRDSAGAQTLTGFANFTWAAGVWYLMRMQVLADGTWRGRVWAEGSAEPGTWLFSVVDASPLADGKFGVGAYSADDAPVDYDAIAMGSSGSTPTIPALPAGTQQGAAALTATSVLVSAGIATDFGAAALTASSVFISAGVRAALGLAALTSSSALVAEGTIPGAAGQITRRASVTTLENTTATTSHVVTKPTGAVAGDVLVAQICTNGQEPVLPAGSGWVVIKDPAVGGSNPDLGSFLLVLTSSHNAVTSWTFTTGSVATSSIGCACYVGVDNTSPFVAATIYAGNGPNLTCASLTVPEAAWLVGGAGLNSSNVGNWMEPPTGWSAKLWDLGGKRSAYADWSGRPAGATGDQTWTTNITFAAEAWVAALRPAPGGGSTTHEGAAGFVASSTFASAAVATDFGTATLTAASTLTSAGVATDFGAATLTASSTLVSAGVRVALGAAAFSSGSTFVGDAVAAPVTSYYVDSAAAGGGNGTIGSPYNTLASVPALTAGKSVLLKRGSVFRESYTTAASGTLADPIIFGAYGTGARPRIVGSTALANGSWVDTASGGRWRMTIAAPTVVWRNDVRMTQAADVASVDTADEWFHDGTYLYVWTGGAAPTAAYEVNARSSCITVQHDYVHLVGLDIRNATDRCVIANAVSTTRYGLSVEDCYLGGDRGLQFAGSGTRGWNDCLVMNCEVRASTHIMTNNAGLYGVGVSFQTPTDGLTIYGCTFGPAGEDALGMDGTPVGNSNFLIENCWFEGGNGENFCDFKGSNVGVIRGCTFDSSTVDNLQYAFVLHKDTGNQSTGVVIENNTFLRGGGTTNPDVIFISGGGNHIVRNNTFSDPRRTPVMIYNTTDPIEVSRNRMWGYGRTNYGAAVNVSTVTAGTSVVIANNVFDAPGASGGPVLWTAGTTAISAVTLRNNYYNNSQPERLDQTVTTRTSSHNVKQGTYTTGDTGSFGTSSPGFTNQASRDYTLAAGSPLINAGTVIAGITDGYVGVAPDIGAHESGSSVTTHLGGAGLNSNSTLVAGGTATDFGATTLTASSALVAAGVRSALGVSALSASSALVAGADRSAAGAAALSATCVFAATATQTTPGALAISNDFESVPVGTQVSAGNTGGTGNTAFGTAALSGSATMVGASDRVAHGSRSVRIAFPSGGTAGPAYVQWNNLTAAGWADTVYIQMYIYIETAPTANVVIARTYATSAEDSATLWLLASGGLRLEDAAGNTQTFDEGGNNIAFAAGTWHRLQWKVVQHATTGSSQVRVFSGANLEGSTPDLVRTVSSLATYGGAVERVRLGAGTSMTTETALVIDSVAAQTNSYPDPLGTPTVTHQGAATLSSSSALASGAVRSTAGAAALAATSTVNAAGVRATAGASALSASSTMAAGAVRGAPGQAALASQSTLGAVAQIGGGVSASLLASSGLSASGRYEATGAASLTAGSTLTTGALATYLAMAVLTGQSSLTATVDPDALNHPPVPGTITLEWIGGLVAIAAVTATQIQIMQEASADAALVGVHAASTSIPAAPGATTSIGTESTATAVITSESAGSVTIAG